MHVLLNSLKWTLNTFNHLLRFGLYSKCTQTLIRVTMKISIRYNTTSLPLWHSITFDVFLQFQRNFQQLWKCNALQLVMQITHLTVPWMPAGLKLQNDTFSKFKTFLPYFNRSETHENVFEERLINLSIFVWNPFVTDTCLACSRHNNHHSKSMHFSVNTHTHTHTHTHTQF